ncbi:hypothetical protein QQ045_020367 [Rhodiola kirilowii]
MIIEMYSFQRNIGRVTTLPHSVNFATEACCRVNSCRINDITRQKFTVVSLMECCRCGGCYCLAPPRTMKILAWNCRGLGSSSAVCALKKTICSSRPLVVGITETKCGSHRCEVIRVKLGFDCCFVVPARGRSGGLALFWNNTTEVDVVSYSGFHIDFRLKHKVSVHITLFYGNPKASLRYKSWDLIRKMRRLISLPWCVIGDFNEICEFSEFTSTNLSHRANMEQFRQVLLDSGLMDLGYKGSKFTYTNKRQGRDEIQCKLDRAIGDDLWIDRYPNTIVQHLVSHHSDHCPLLLNLDGITRVQEKPFRFESMWMRDANITDIINKTGFLMAALLISSHISPSTFRQGTRTKASSDKEKSIAKEIDEWLLREESIWAQRSRVSWLSEGDNNTRFFHLKANDRRRINTISTLVDQEGRSHSNQNDIENVAVSYFCDLFASAIRLTDSDINTSLQCIPSIVTEEHNRVLL